MNKIKKLRRKLKLTQHEFAGLLSVAQQKISDWENERCEIPRYILAHIDSLILLNKHNLLNDYLKKR